MKHITDTHGGHERWTTDDDRTLLRKENDGLYLYCFPIAPTSWRLLPEFKAAIEDAIRREQQRRNQ